MIMNVNVYSLDGKASGKVELPKEFGGFVRADLIKRAVLSEESKLYQPKGNYKFAGMETSARYRGRKEDFGAIKNMGITHQPREVLPEGRFGKVKRIPTAVKGRRAHGPKPEKKIIENINPKEYARALASALAATANMGMVAKRHPVEIKQTVPLVLDDSVEQIAKTKEVLKLIESLQLSGIVEKGRSNGSRGMLIVVSDSGKLKAARNIAGVDVQSVSDLQVRHLAPGTHPGRLVLFSKKALLGLAQKFEGRESKKKSKVNQ